jgi:hypothetical protein
LIVVVVKPLLNGWRKRVLAEIGSGDLDDLLSAAGKVSRKLGAPGVGQYRRWLRETVGSLRPQCSEVIEALGILTRFGDSSCEEYLPRTCAFC